jgi:hypothetical protein
VNEPDPLGEIDPQTRHRRLVDDVHVLRPLNDPAVCVVQGDAVLATRHTRRIRSSGARVFGCGNDAPKSSLLGSSTFGREGRWRS